MSGLDLLHQVVNQRFGCRPSEIEHIETWGPHSVIRFRCGSETLFFKTQQPGRSNQAEAWACGQARSVGVPAPDIIEVDSGSPWGVPYLLMYELPGRPLTYDDPAGAVIEKLGSLLRGFGRIPISGYGRVHPIGDMFRGQYQSWQSFITTTFHGYMTLARENHDLDSKLQKRLERLLELFNTELATFSEPCFLNGDLHLGSVFVSDEMEIVGLVDFADVSSGDVLWEIARFSVEVDRNDVSEQPFVIDLARGLDRVAYLSTPLFHFYRAYWAVQEITWASEFTAHLVDRPHSVLTSILNDLVP